MKRFFIFLPVFISVLHFACRQTTLRTMVPAFYHWQTNLEITPEENRYLDSVRCKKLYIKVLDIGVNELSGAVEPYARLHIADTTGLSRYEIIPVIFITNAVFKKTDPEKTDWLVEKTAGALAAFPFLISAREIQFDCDWTASTREAFFLFLKKMQQAVPEKQLSATIRLHQYKFPKQTGVPPVARGMLMFYNTGDIESETTENSIFNLQDAEKYVQGAPKTYPLPLDLALPVFSWTLVYREGEFWKIINGVPTDLQDTTRFETFLPDRMHLQVRKGTFLSGHYLRPGDRLRVETVSEELLLQAAGLAARTDLADDASLAFFHLDTSTIRNFSPKLIHTVCQKTGFPDYK